MSGFDLTGSRCVPTPKLGFFCKRCPQRKKKGVRLGEAVVIIWVTAAPARRRRCSPPTLPALAPQPFPGTGVQAVLSPWKRTLLGVWKSGGGIREVQNKLVVELSLQRVNVEGRLLKLGVGVDLGACCWYRCRERIFPFVKFSKSPSISRTPKVAISQRRAEGDWDTPDPVPGSWVGAPVCI